MSELQLVNFYVDGACRDNHGGHIKGFMGVGIVGIHGSQYAEWSLPVGHGTSNIAELIAVREALSLLKRRPECHVMIHSDSAYAIGALTQAWKLKANLEVIASIVPLIAECGRFEMVKVTAHSGHEMNEIANRLATIASRTK